MNASHHTVQEVAATRRADMLSDAARYRMVRSARRAQRAERIAARAAERSASDAAEHAERQSLRRTVVVFVAAMLKRLRAEQYNTARTNVDG